jgi:AAA15 family ATPase/GTPase
MLLRFRFSNVRSFRDEQELSLVAGPGKDLPELVRHPPGVREGVLPLAAMYGANASGKTNVLRSLAFMKNAVSASYRKWKPDGPIPRDPFLADESSRGQGSEFVVDFLLRGIRHQYGFRLDSESVLEEWLHVYPNAKKQTWFHRKAGVRILFSSKLPGENRTIENLTRKNCLFLSAAAQNNHEALLPIYQWFVTSVIFVMGGRSDEVTKGLCAASESRRSISSLLAAADLGIVDIQIQEENRSDVEKRVLEAVVAIIRSDGAPDPPIPETVSNIQLVHRFGDRLSAFTGEQESDGTIAYLAVLGPVVDAIRNGALMCIDELDASLHPLLAGQLTRLFNSPSSNPRGAQLIFTTHDINLLGAGLLRRDQVWFTEKNNDGASHLYPLSDFKPRKEENLQSGYLQGRYGAIPFINPDAFLARLEDGNEQA